METNSSSSPFLKIKEAAEYLKVKVSTLYKWVHERKVPFRKHGRSLVFKIADLEHWSARNSVEILSPLTSLQYSSTTAPQKGSLKTKEGSSAGRGSKKGA